MTLPRIAYVVVGIYLVTVIIAALASYSWASSERDRDAGRALQLGLFWPFYAWRAEVAEGAARSPIATLGGTIVAPST